MKCPNCLDEMQNKSFMYYGLADWDADYPSSLYEKYYCKECKIKYENGDWIIPKKYEKATDKQIKCISIINKNLGTSFMPLTKDGCRRFISENIEKSKQNATKINWDAEVYDMDYINDLWCEHY